MSGCGRGRQQRVNDQDESERPVLTAGSRAAGTIFHDHREARLVRRTRDDECGGVLTVKGASDHSLQQSIGGEIVVAGCAQNTAAVSQEAVAAAQKRESRSVRAHDAAQPALEFSSTTSSRPRSISAILVELMSGER